MRISNDLLEKVGQARSKDADLDKFLNIILEQLYNTYGILHTVGNAENWPDMKDDVTEGHFYAIRAAESLISDMQDAFIAIPEGEK